MADPMDLFPSVVGTSATTTAPVTTAVEAVDLRLEFEKLILGYAGETPIGQPFILRRMRRTNGELVACSCLDTVYNHPSRDYPCPYCLGAGHLWDEELVIGYKVVSAAPGGSNAEVNIQELPAGVAYLPAILFYFSYDSAITIDDRVVEIELDDSGDAVTPYNRLAIYEMLLVREMRGDSGKIEFVVCNGQRMGPNTLGSVS